MNVAIDGSRYFGTNDFIECRHIETHQVFLPAPTRDVPECQSRNINSHNDVHGGNDRHYILVANSNLLCID